MHCKTKMGIKRKGKMLYEIRICFPVLSRPVASYIKQRSRINNSSLHYSLWKDVYSFYRNFTLLEVICKGNFNCQCLNWCIIISPNKVINHWIFIFIQQNARQLFTNQLYLKFQPKMPGFFQDIVGDPRSQDPDFLELWTWQGKWFRNTAYIANTFTYC